MPHTTSNSPVAQAVTNAIVQALADAITQVAATHDVVRSAATTKIQRFVTRKVVTDAANFGMTSKKARSITFAALSKRLKDPELIKVMKRVLHRVCVLTVEGVRSCPGAEETKNVNVRIFVASFMIAYHTTNVFDSINKLETDLKIAAVEMLKVFDTLCLAILDAKLGADIKEPVEKALAFPGVLHTYLKAFSAWKLVDEVKLTDRLLHALTALFQAEDHLEEGDVNTPKLRAEFRGQQERLRSKLVQIAGEKALKALDDTRASQGHARRTPVKAEAVEADATRGGGGTEGGFVESTHGGLLYSTLPHRMTNEQLAHELLLAPTFKFDDHGARLQGVREEEIKGANARLQLIAPTIKKHGVEYECNNMDEKIRQGILTLTQTSTWLRETIRELVATGTSLDDVAVNDSNRSVTLEGRTVRLSALNITVLNAGVVALVTGAKAPSVATCPETLLLDVTRLATEHEGFRFFVLVASILVIVSQRIGELHVPNHKPIIITISERVLTTAPRAREPASVVATVMEMLEPVMSVTDRARLCNALLTATDAKRPVPKLLESRLRNVLRRGIVLHGIGELHAAFVMAEFQLPEAAASLLKPIKEMVIRLSDIIRLNTNVHAKRYTDLIAVEAARVVEDSAVEQPVKRQKLD